MKQINVDLLPLIHKLEAVLKRGLSREILAGSYQSVFKGKGLEFVGFREFTPADDAMQIDWKASLKAHKLMVRVLQEERDLTVFFLFDVSDSMLFSSHKKLKCEYAAELIGTMAYAMQSVGDNVGMAMFTDKMVNVILPSTGRNQFYNMVRTLSDPLVYGGKFNLDTALTFLMNTGFLKPGSIVFVVSDFIGLKQGWEKNMKLAGLKYDLTAVVIRDPVDMRMPEVEGEIQLSDPYTTKNQRLISPLDAKRMYEAEAKNQIERLRKELIKTRSDILYLETTEDFTSAIFNFFRQRQKAK
jgi:hypothetical protein